MASTTVRQIRRKVISTPDAPAAIGHYRQSKWTTHYICQDRLDWILSGSDHSWVAGTPPGKDREGHARAKLLGCMTGEMVSDDVVLQTNQALKNIGAVLSAAGSSPQNVVKTTVFLADIGDFSKVNEAYSQFFGSNKPARAAYQAAALPKNAKIKIEVIAVVGEVIDE